MYLHDPRILSPSVRSNTRKKVSPVPEELEDAFFWPTMESVDVIRKTNSTGQPAVDQKYVVPFPGTRQVVSPRTRELVPSPHTVNDIGIYSMWDSLGVLVQETQEAKAHTEDPSSQSSSPKWIAYHSRLPLFHDLHNEAKDESGASNYSTDSEVNAAATILVSCATNRTEVNHKSPHILVMSPSEHTEGTLDEDGYLTPTRSIFEESDKREKPALPSPQGVSDLLDILNDGSQSMDTEEPEPRKYSTLIPGPLRFDDFEHSYQRMLGSETDEQPMLAVPQPLRPVKSTPPPGLVDVRGFLHTPPQPSSLMRQHAKCASACDACSSPWLLGMNASTLSDSKTTCERGVSSSCSLFSNNESLLPRPPNCMDTQDQVVGVSLLQDHWTTSKVQPLPMQSRSLSPFNDVAQSGHPEVLLNMDYMESS